MITIETMTDELHTYWSQNGMQADQVTHLLKEDFLVQDILVACQVQDPNHLCPYGS